jgi:transposase, IS30 family
MNYRQITSGERYMISALRMQGLSLATIADQIGRHRSSVSREIRRNQCDDGAYRPSKADSRTRTRRSHSRRNWRFSERHLHMVITLLRLDWSPEQIAGWLRLYRVFDISHQTIYRHIWDDRCYGGRLHKRLRQAAKQRRKRYRRPDSRGILPNKRHISERPPGAQNRSRFGHWESDTVMGAHDRHCIVTLVERKSKYVIIGKLRARTTEELNRKVIALIERERPTVKTITADNGTEFHSYTAIENETGARFYFATPYHSWERGLNENTNGLIRQYLPKGKSMARLTQQQCDAIATKLNRRPRKTLGYKTPEQIYATI